MMYGQEMSRSPDSSWEVLHVFASRLGRAFRSARRDMWRLRCSDDFPVLFGSAAKTLQLCGLELLPDDRNVDTDHRMRRSARELIELLTCIADSHGDIKRENHKAKKNTSGVGPLKDEVEGGNGLKNECFMTRHILQEEKLFKGLSSQKKRGTG